jgi:hypothetical protein
MLAWIEAAGVDALVVVTRPKWQGFLVSRCLNVADWHETSPDDGEWRTVECRGKDKTGKSTGEREPTCTLTNPQHLV